MRVMAVTVGKEVLVSTGQYENVRIKKEMTVELDAGESEAMTVRRVTEDVNNYLRDEVDNIELGKRKANSRANRFGL